MEKMNASEMENKVVERKVICQFMEKQCNNCRHYWGRGCFEGYCYFNKMNKESDDWCPNWEDCVEEAYAKREPENTLIYINDELNDKEDAE